MAPAATEDATELGVPDIKPPPGVIAPPKDMRSFLERTADMVVRRKDSVGLEDRVRKSAETTPKLQFIYPDNPYHAYYQWRKTEIAEGRGQMGADGNTPNPTKPVKKGPEAPPDFHFSARMPTISAVDLEIVKLTALYVAKNGRSWLAALLLKEQSNYQYDFLRSTHSFHNFFQRLVDQYTELLNGDSVDGGKPQKARVEALKHNVKDKYHILDRARKRAEWTRHQEAQKVKKDEEAEKEKMEYAQIDWHDFVVVGTIEFTEADDQVELPPPTLLYDLQSASLEQKAAMNVAPPNMRIEEVMPDMPEFFGYQQPPPAQVSTPQPSLAPPPPPQQGYSPSPLPQPSVSPAPYVPQRSAQDLEDEARIAERTAERERAAQAQAAAKGTGPMRIRNDYVPRAQARRQAGNTALCQICKQQIPLEEYEQHVRIEMLDPRWREQSRIAAQRSSTTNLSTADVANNLKRLASQRSDVFDPVTGQNLSEEEAQRRKRIELGSYDGVANAGAPGAGAMGGADGKPLTDVQEQIRQLQSKYGGS